MSETQPAEVPPTQTDAQATDAPAAPVNRSARVPVEQTPNPVSGTSLHVSNLDLSVTEAVLYETFSPYAPIVTLRICRDAQTQRSLGHGYINYKSVEDCQAAFNALGYDTMLGQNHLRVQPAMPDPSFRKSGVGNIFIKNLHKSISEAELFETLHQFGKIVSLRIPTDANRKSLGHAFVHFQQKACADHAIATLNGNSMLDQIVYAAHHIPRKERQERIKEQRGQFTNIYVKNVDTAVTEEEFRKLFEPFGEITSAVLQVADGVSKGFGFVNYKTHDEAQKAVDGLHDKEVNGKKLYVARAQKKTEREEELKSSFEAAKMEKQAKWQGVNLYIKNLDDDMDDDALRAAFEGVGGTITSVKVMRDEKGTSLGFGFVCFSTPEEASKAITEMNGVTVGSKPLYVSLAQRRDIRRQQLEQQIAQRNQIRMQQAAGGGIAGGYLGAPMYYPPFPPQGYGYGPYPPMMAPGRGGPRGGMPGYGIPPGFGPGHNMPGGGRNNRGPGPRPNGTPANGTGHLPASGPTDIPAESPEQQRQAIGEVLYGKIYKNYNQEHTGKITGMILEMDLAELTPLLTDDALLAAKVDEAIGVLQQNPDSTITA